MKEKGLASLVSPFIVLAITVSLAAFPVGIAQAGGFPEGDVLDIIFNIERVDIVHTTDLSVAGEVMTIFEGPASFSLFDFHSGVLAELGMTVDQLPDGFVTEFRLVVTNAFVTLDHRGFPIFIPGGVVKLAGVFEIPENLDAVFVFDVEKAVLRTRGRGFMLKPVIDFETVGALDIFNDPAAGTSFGCGSGGESRYQSFAPTASQLAAVQLRLRAGGSFPAGGTYTTVNLRADSPTGSVLGSATVFVPGPQVSFSQVLVHFGFSPAITLTPGDTYVVEWLSPAPAGVAAGTILTWLGRTDNPYPGGTAFGCTGISVASDDLNFRTYAP